MSAHYYFVPSSITSVLGIAAAMAPSTSSPLQFAPFASHVSPSFWTALAAVKIDRLQLSDDSVSIEARYTIGKQVVDRSTGDTVHMPPYVSLDDASLDSVASSSTTAAMTNGAHVRVGGTLKNFNTVEDFKKADKPALLQQAGQKLLLAMQHDEDPTAKLTQCLLLSYADLKKYKFIYWFAFPALVEQPAWHVAAEASWRPAQDVFDGSLLSAVASAVTTTQHGSFLLRPDGKTAHVMEYDGFFDGIESNERTVVFVDPSSLPDAPGWPLRNLLALLSVRFQVDLVRVLCWRDDVGGTHERSIVGTVATKCSDAAATAATAHVVLNEKHLPLARLRSASPSQPSVVGWERNAAGKLAPKMADLGPLMDPSRLADQAVDLNLKLMRWRILPEINLEKIQATRCLLLGSGTLGCYVARTLLGWGVRHITLIDSSTVSFSNPVRQPLFTFDDCLHGGKPKAECAAESLRRIYPGVRSQGIQLNIPMPGHPIPPTSVEQVRKDVTQLEALFDGHDVVYLLMDSRESRWLPTVLGAAKGKMVLNAALGFDTFLAMRHGASPTQHAQQSTDKPSSRLGCYFCNDIVAPTDSLTDRTLDQMCTVSRPGLAAVASASTVEMMVSLLQHPLGTLAPAYAPPSTNAGTITEGTSAAGSASILGHLPHQLRGSLFNFQNMLIHGPAYDRCTACSQTVIDAYVQQPFEVVQSACNDEAYLRTLTGLDKLYDATDDVEVDWSEEEDGSGGGGME